MPDALTTRGDARTSSAAGADPPDVLARQLAEHQRVAAGMAPLLVPLARLGDLLCSALAGGGRLLTLGNGGSAADAQHLASELIGRYQRERRSLPALALTVDPSVLTCVGNDYGFDDVFARQVRGLATAGDVVAAFTTSGRSPNVVAGLAAARDRGATTALFSAGDGGEAARHADVALLVPAAPTPRVQEMHLLLLHLLSDWVDIWAARTEPEHGSTGR